MGGPGDFAGQRLRREKRVESRLDLAGDRRQSLVKGVCL
jgi:hypothetical protein